MLEMVTKIRAMDMEVCTTLGMIDATQAADLRGAGLTAYNHNLDTSPEFYKQVRSPVWYLGMFWLLWYALWLRCVWCALSCRANCSGPALCKQGKFAANTSQQASVCDKQGVCARSLPSVATFISCHVNP